MAVIGTRPPMSEGVDSPWRRKPGGEGLAYRLSERILTNLSSPLEDGVSTGMPWEHFGLLGPLLLRGLVFT